MLFRVEIINQRRPVHPVPQLQQQPPRPQPQPQPVVQQQSGTNIVPAPMKIAFPALDTLWPMNGPDVKWVSD